MPIAELPQMIAMHEGASPYIYIPPFTARTWPVM